MTEQSIELCPDCQRKKALQETERSVIIDDRETAAKQMRARAEGCRYFCHHTLYLRRSDGLVEVDKSGEPKIDPQMGSRVCSFIVAAGCGHKFSIHGECDAWYNVKECPDWVQK